MKRRHFLAAGSAIGAAALSFPFISHAIANSNAWTIGSTAAMTGPLGGFDLENQKGVQAALAQINARGGVHDRPVQMEILDDGYVSARSVENIKQLAANPAVVGLMSCLGTANNAAITPMIEAAGLVHLAPLTGASSLRKSGLRHVFHIRASYSGEIARLVQNVASMGIKNLALVYTDNPYGKEVSGETASLLTSAGISILGTHALSVDGKNMEAVVAQIVASNPSAVVLGTTGAATTGLVAALRKASPSMPIAGISPSLTQQGVRHLGMTARGLAITRVGSRYVDLGILSGDGRIMS